MPSGRTHLGIETAVLALAVSVGAMWVRRGSLSAETLAAFACGFAFGMFFLSPDLDLARSRPAKRWGILSILWWPYARLFRHRGLSHHIFWGPLTRLAYLAVIAAAAYFALGAMMGRPVLPRLVHVEVLAVLLGVYTPNVVHVLVDGAGGVTRRKKRW
jgi:uncharacterized metal-binding protein